MPTFSEDALSRIINEFFLALGSSAEEARTVADHLVESNMLGHDSHGLLKCDLYSRFLKWGALHLNRQPEIVKETACTASVDAHRGLGAVGATFATKLAIRKATEHGVASVCVKEVGHIGRAGGYALMAAREGLMCQVSVNSGGPHILVAPFGSNEGRMSTNPLGFCAPRRNADPVMVDMASSSAAEGKVRVAYYNNKPVPEGWIFDPEGRPTTNPADYYDDTMKPIGAITSLGGVAGHKGYCLGLTLELLGGALSGEGCATDNKFKLAGNGVTITAWNIEFFTDLEEYYDNVEQVIAHVKAARRLPGVDEILIPGEPEFRAQRERREHGVFIDENTWQLICERGREYGADADSWNTLASEART